MVKFSGLTKDGAGRLIGIALSRKNCEKMLEGQPITIDLAEFGLRVTAIGEGEPYDQVGDREMPGQVLIIAGETEQKILVELQQVARGEGVPIRTFWPDGRPVD